MRLTKFNPETGQYEYIEKAKTLTEFRAQRKAVIQKLGEYEDKAQKYYIHSDGRIEMIPTVESVRADTVREMQERLDKHFCHDPAFLGVEQRLIMGVIDEIAKEMLEGKSNEE